ncbi:MAG: DUF5674 family protein [Candidatus Margulisbacteria bacterium]|nr:DUF5674 family protein [Candidatus Margulisiibacteriota bacterium]
MPDIIIASSVAPVTHKMLKTLQGKPYEDMIKFVVDIEEEKIAFGGEMHSDAEYELLQNGSSQQNLWGANYYPLRKTQDRIEYTSLINIRPSIKNLSMEIQSEEIKNRINTILKQCVRDK